ncbi:hypothetical protein TNCV_4727241 [Trichonephila clavipes]|nr:hypothetical protein TNCV_4727241 [Trichonephila clavipes]
MLSTGIEPIVVNTSLLGKSELANLSSNAILQKCPRKLLAARDRRFPTTEKMKGSCLINSSIVLGLRIIGKDFQLAKVMCFPRFTFPVKTRHQERKLLKATERVAQENINAALSEIKGSNSFTKYGISIDGINAEATHL